MMSDIEMSVSNEALLKCICDNMESKHATHIPPNRLHTLVTGYCIDCELYNNYDTMKRWLSIHGVGPAIP